MRLFPRVACNLILTLTLLTGGCNSHSFYELVPTPSLYTGQIEPDRLDNLPSSLQTPAVEVIYFTDRVREEDSERGHEYGYHRSRSSAFGTMRVNFGKLDTWEKLVAESRQTERTSGIKVWSSHISELGRFPPTPEPSHEVNGKWMPLPEVAAAREQTEAAFRSLVRERLAQTPDKSIYIFVHGYNCEFEWPAYMIAQLWHFMGRGGVPVAYSWPAARPGALRGYQYDRESSEFTILHFKRMLLLLGSMPEVEKVHILAHSRGTDVAVTSIRELRIASDDPLKTRAQIKLGTLVLAAADLDAEVATQRITPEGVPLVPERLTLYVSKGDRALGLSSWLFGSARRIGMLRPEDLKKPASQYLLNNYNIEVIDAQINVPKMFSHSYFFAHPGAMSDLILLFRDQRRAGAEFGRPLKRDPTGFWIIDKDYPASQPASAQEASSPE